MSQTILPGFDYGQLSSLLNQFNPSMSIPDIPVRNNTANQMPIPQGPLHTGNMGPNPIPQRTNTGDISNIPDMPLHTGNTEGIPEWLNRLFTFARQYQPGPWDQYFDTNNTDMPTYNNMIDDKTIVSTGEGNFTKKDYYKKFKGVKSELMLYSPEEYFQESNKMHGGKMTDEEYSSANTDSELIKRYLARSLGGSKAPLPVLDYSRNEQEGRHRAIVAKKLGLEEFPVLKVEKS